MRERSHTDVVQAACAAATTHGYTPTRVRRVKDTPKIHTRQDRTGKTARLTQRAWQVFLESGKAGTDQTVTLLVLVRERPSGEMEVQTPRELH